MLLFSRVDWLVSRLSKKVHNIGSCFRKCRGTGILLHQGSNLHWCCILTPTFNTIRRSLKSVQSIATGVCLKMATKSGKPKKGLTVPGSKEGRRSAKFREPKFKDENKESLAWKVLPEAFTKEVMEVEAVEEVQDKMVTYLEVFQHQSDLKEASILDYYVSAIWWAREQSFSASQTSAFYTLVHTLLENLKEKQMSLVDNLVELKKALVGIGLDHCEGSGGLECFQTNQAKLISQYMNNSLFQHYKLYEFMFSTTQAEEIIGTDLEIEVAPPCDMPWPPPLEEAVVEGLHQEYIATPHASPEPEVEAQTEAAPGESTEAEGHSEAEHEVTQKEADLLAQLTPDQVKAIMQEVFSEMLTGLQTDVAQKLRDKENSFINRINKIHKVAEK